MRSVGSLRRTPLCDFNERGTAPARRPGPYREGACADLVILDGNPFDEPSVLWDERRNRTVIKAGHVVPSGGFPVGSVTTDEVTSGATA